MPTKPLCRLFGAPLTIVEPGVSIKPYPSGILTHQSMDAMLKLVLDHDLKARRGRTHPLLCRQEYHRAYSLSDRAESSPGEILDAGIACNDHTVPARQPSRVRGQFRRRQRHAGSAGADGCHQRSEHRCARLRQDPLAHRGGSPRTAGHWCNGPTSATAAGPPTRSAMLDSTTSFACAPRA